MNLFKTFGDFLSIHAVSKNLTREEYTAYYLSEGKPAGAPDFHDSKAPDAHGKFRDLSIEDLAKWLIDTRNGDVKKISGSLTQQIVFNRNDNPEYAEKMEKTRQEVYKQLGREDLMEADAKPGPDKYMTGLDKEDEEDKEDQIKKQRAMDDDDSDAYKEMPGDKEAREKGQVKTSKHVKKYHELYGEETDEALSDYEDKDADYDKLYKKYKYTTKNRKKKKELVKEETENAYRLRVRTGVGGDEADEFLKNNDVSLDKIRMALRNKKFTKYDLRDVIQGKAVKSIEKLVMKHIKEDVDASVNECWDGYKQVGMKTKGGKQVPDCVPESEEHVDEAVKLGCMECDEVNTLAKWEKNGGYCPSCKTSSSAVQESSINEEKAEGDRSPLDNADIEKALKKKSEETGVPIGLIRIIMRRGMAAWKTGHRPGAGQEQWGYARVNAFLTKGDGTWGGADKDVAKEVRDGGHDSKLKS